MGLRLFVSINMSDEIKCKIANAQEQLKEKGIFGKYTSKDGLHITLSFLGDADVEMVPSIISSIEENLSDSSSFTFRLGKIGAFPSLRKASVMWIGVDKDGENRIISIQGIVSNALIKIGFPKEERPYHPHVTISRLRDFRSNAGKVITDDLIDMSETEIKVSSIFLMKSEITKKGAVHTVINQFKLKH